ncbi:acetyltransferase [bacterium DOLZORAL124_64_63]|nr:MAG: acetyltransferase [bacterium DOLZORAL124_64_63]
MLGFLKRVVWDLQDPIGRFNFCCWFWREYPGVAGQIIRAKVLLPYFARAGKGVIIHEGVRFRTVHKLAVGDDCELGVDSFLQAGGGITLGDRVMLGPGVKIWSVNHVFRELDVPINEQGFDEEPVRIGDDCWLGANVFVFPGVDLPRGCVVSAGSVVAKKRYPEYAILAGYPARVIGNRKTNASSSAAAAQDAGAES